MVWGESGWQLARLAQQDEGYRGVALSLFARLAFLIQTVVSAAAIPLSFLGVLWSRCLSCYFEETDAHLLRRSLWFFVHTFALKKSLHLLCSPLDRSENRADFWLYQF
jgi:hypothetical protein